MILPFSILESLYPKKENNYVITQCFTNLTASWLYCEQNVKKGNDMNYDGCSTALHQIFLHSHWFSWYSHTKACFRTFCLQVCNGT